MKKQPKQNNFKTVSAPISKSARYSQRPPKINTTGRVVTVKHCEYIADIVASSSAFGVIPFSVNPGLNTTFPWLSAVAGNFESYKFKNLTFEYKPICPTTTAGKIILAMDYDAADAAPSSKLVMSSYESSVNCSVWDQIAHDSTKLNLNKFGVQRFVRTGTVPANTDVKTYDIGKFYVGTSNTPATPTTLGELYVHYDVELYTPQFATNPSEFSPKPPVGGFPIMQLIKIAVGAAGAVSLTSEYFGKLIAAIGQTSVQSGEVQVDIILNPTIEKGLKLEHKIPITSGTIFGRGAKQDGQFPTKYMNSIGNFVLDIFDNSNTHIQDSFFIQNTPGLVDTPNSNNLPGFRYILPFNSETSLNLTATDMYMGSAWGELSPIGTQPGAPVDTDINWAKLSHDTGLVGFAQAFDENGVRLYSEATPLGNTF
jgi:hypothetical protein